MPRSFRARNWAMRKTRFGPEVIEQQHEEGHRRHMLTPEERGAILNDAATITKPTVTETTVIIEKETEPMQAASTPDVIKSTKKSTNFANIFDDNR